MNLPEIEVIGLQPPQRLFQHLHRQLGTAAVRAYLGHQENLLAAALERPAHPILRSAVEVLPAVIEKIDAGSNGLVNEFDRLLDAAQAADVMAAHADGRYADTSAA